MAIDKNNLAFYRLMKDYLACVAGFKWWRYHSVIDKREILTYSES
jgi:hypothetical protein